LELAKRDAQLILACRDQKRGQEALHKIKLESKNTKIELEQLDLSSLKSIKDLSDRI
jgi:short-subunit dehydrogenase